MGPTLEPIVRPEFIYFLTKVNTLISALSVMSVITFGIALMSGIYAFTQVGGKRFAKLKQKIVYTEQYLTPEQLVSLISYINEKAEYDVCAKFHKRYKRICIISSILFFTSAIGAMVIPDRDTIISMYAASLVTPISIDVPSMSTGESIQIIIDRMARYNKALGGRK